MADFMCPRHLIHVALGRGGEMKSGRLVGSAPLRKHLIKNASCPEMAEGSPMSSFLD